MGVHSTCSSSTRSPSLPAMRQRLLSRNWRFLPTSSQGRPDRMELTKKYHGGHPFRRDGLLFPLFASSFSYSCAGATVYRGEDVCPPQLCDALFRFVPSFSRRSDRLSLARPPTPFLFLCRQKQLVTLVARANNKEIASQLNLSEFTSEESHPSNLLTPFACWRRREDSFWKPVAPTAYSISH